MYTYKYTCIYINYTHTHAHIMYIAKLESYLNIYKTYLHIESQTRKS